MSLNSQFKVKNDLNVLGKILSAGRDLEDLFSQATASFTVESVNNSTSFQVSGGDSFKLSGETGIFVTANRDTETLVISGVDATADRKGVAKFSSSNFDITEALVTVKSGGISNSNLAANSVDKSIINASSIVKTNGALSFTTSDGFSTNVDNSTIEINGSNNLQVKDDGITGAKLNANVVDDSTLQLASDQLKIKDSGVTGTKLNSNVADNSTIELHSNALRVKDNGITNAKLADNAVTKAEIDPSAIVYPTGAISFTTANGLSANVDSVSIEIASNNLQVKDSGISNAKLAANSVTKGKIDASNIVKSTGAISFNTSDGFFSNTDNSTIEINGSNNLQIKDSGITNAKLAANSVTKSKIDASSILKSSNNGLTFTTTDGFSVNVDTTSIELNTNNLSIVDGGVTNIKLAANSVTKGKIDASNILKSGGALSFTTTDGFSTNVDNTTIEIASNNLQIKDSGITNAKLANDGIYFGDGTSSAKTALGATFHIKGTSNQLVATFNVGAPANNVTLSLPSSLSLPGDLTVANGTGTFEELTVNKTLIVAGSARFVNTIVTTSSALSVINTGPTRALYVKNTNPEYDIASFYDGDGTEVLHVGNHEVDARGVVGINIANPANSNAQPTLVGLTVNGQISANEGIIALGSYSSYQWGHTYTTVLPNSANWNTAYNAVNTKQDLWDSTYSTYQVNSASYLKTQTDVTVTGLNVSDGTRASLRKVYSGSTITNNNILHVNTLDVGTVSAVKYIILIRNNTTGRRASAEILALLDNNTWSGTVYAMLDPAGILNDIDISTPASSIRLTFTFNANASYSVTALADGLDGP